MKKIFVPLLTAILTAASLSACSSPAKETTAAPVAETTVKETAIEETTIDETTVEETESEAAEAGFTLRIGSLKGPTSMGLVSLMDKSEKGESEGSYEFTMVTAANELLAKVLSGEIDIALIPSNVASILNNKSDHSVNVLNINTLGVLYVVSGDETIKSIADLKGKTLYMTGKGTTPDYVINYLLSSNGLTTDDVKLEYKSEAAEVASVLKENPDAAGLLPQPFVTVACAQNEALEIVLDLTKEWDNIQNANGSSLVTGVTVCRSELFADNNDAVEIFLKEQKDSVEFTNANPEKAAELIAKAGIIEQAPVAQKALPYCSITYIDGNEMKEMLYGYLEVLYNQNPDSVGGKLPEKSFFYIP